jgi:hypothetical protein
MAYDSIQIMSSKIESPRIGVCTTQFIGDKGLLNTDGKGCKSGEGIGKGVKMEGCAGSGASHGGSGGPGAKLNETSNELCENFFPTPYLESDLDARYEGSGGASSRIDSGLGGSGGGIVWISAADRITLKNSAITA